MTPKTVRYLIIGIGLFVSSISQGQNNKGQIQIDDLWTQYGKQINNNPPNYTAAVEELQKLKEIARDSNNLSEAIYGDIYLAWTLFKFNQIEKGKQHLDLAFQELQEKEKKLTNASDIYSNIHYIFGLYYYEHQIDFASALQHYERCKKWIKKGGKLYFSTYDLTNNIGLIYQKMGAYQMAMDNYNLFVDTLNVHPQGVATRYSNMANTAMKMGEYDMAYKRLSQAKHFLDKLGYSEHTQNTYSQLYNLFAKYYNQKNQPKRAHAFLDKIEDATEYNNVKLTTYRNRAFAFLTEKKHQQAKNYIDQAIKLFNQEKLTNLRIGQFYQLYGNLYQQTNQPKKALEYYQKTLTVFGKDFQNILDFNKNPESAHFSLENDLLETLEAKATVLEQIGNKEAALITYQQADKIFNDLRVNYLSNTSSKYFWIAKVKPLYEKIIALALAMDKKEVAYHFCQKSHATVLWEMMQSIEAKDLGNVPGSLVELEKQLNIKIAAEELKITNDSTSTVKQTLFTAKEKLFQLQKQLEIDNPLYHQIKYTLPITKLQNVQAKLKTEEALIEYFIGETYIYTFVISKNKFKVYSRKKPSNFSTLLQQLRQSTAKYEEDNLEMFTAYKEAAFALYQLLLQDIHTDFPINQFTIIPDEELGYLNFGLLLSSPQATYPRYDKLPYLINQYYFNYNYSSVLFVKLNRHKQRKRHSDFLVGFAPVFPGNPGLVRQGLYLDSLINNLPEVEYIQSVVGGIVYKDTSATRTNFQESNQQYKIGHLATHATCDDINPERSTVHFVDTTLSCKEIYNLDLNYELVVLSACETGVGKLQKAEGIISLARAFMSAGCPSVITSLWQVNDKSTADVMRFFYENIATQQQKHIALINAQRKYINEASPSKAHPFYWGAFVSIGNTDAVSADYFTEFYWVTGLIGLLILFFLFKRNK